MKSELLVIADQHAAVNAFPGLVHTARHTTRVVCTRNRPSHHPSRLHPKSSAQPAREGGAEGVEGKGGEVVTRYPYENVRMDHLLSRENNLSRENKNLI